MQCDAVCATLAAARKQSISPITRPLRQVHSYAGDFEGVLGVWRRMGAAGFAPTAKLWGSLLVACSAAGQLEQAGIFWWEMKQLHAEGNASVITTDNVCAMMTACNGAGQVRLVRGAGWNKAGQCRGQRAAVARLEGCGLQQPGLWVYCRSLASLACQPAAAPPHSALPQYERCLAAFQEAKALGVAMDVRAYNIALRACHTPGKTLRQEQLMQVSRSANGVGAPVWAQWCMQGSWELAACAQLLQEAFNC